MKIGILLDSSAGFKVGELNSKIIEVLPLHLIINDENDFLETEESIIKNNLSEEVKSDKRKSTSQASPGELMVKYDEMLKKYEHIIHLSIPENLSSMMQTAFLVTADQPYKGKVTVIKHSMAANALKYLALKYEQMINKGITDLELFQKEADTWEKETFLALIPSNLQTLARGGRAKMVILKFLKIVKAKVSIQWGKKPKKIGISRTYGSLFDKTMSVIIKEMDKDFKLFLLLREKEVNSKLISTVHSYLEDNKINYKFETLSLVFPWHAGSDTIALIAIKKDLLPDVAFEE
ncbi:fatty acid-binding protein DegV [Spiroplasma corruscae]|uniref:Fatty acid-binding protein DegV n=1 Tax=Spiroplasma corruscae TaxID=216934 RepID=A0A222EN53_9MOLU|nr:DegV family protein [Spiroplasma corruscae]ASP27915.1 fatty acid-binding protein DegV [Spiroplasma corruscae]